MKRVSSLIAEIETTAFGDQQLLSLELRSPS